MRVSELFYFILFYFKFILFDKKVMNVTALGETTEDGFFEVDPNIRFFL